jgi:hypothetical protein
MYSCLKSLSRLLREMDWVWGRGIAYHMLDILFASNKRPCFSMCFETINNYYIHLIL